MINNAISQNLTIAHWNCNSITSHKSDITQLLTKNFNFLCINETKLANKDNIHFPNYNITRKDRNCRDGYTIKI